MWGETVGDVCLQLRLVLAAVAEVWIRSRFIGPELIPAFFLAIYLRFKFHGMPSICKLTQSPVRPRNTYVPGQISNPGVMVYNGFDGMARRRRR